MILNFVWEVKVLVIIAFQVIFHLHFTCFQVHHLLPICPVHLCWP